jgi:hypothetical protein
LDLGRWPKPAELYKEPHFPADPASPEGRRRPY